MSSPLGPPALMIAPSLDELAVLCEEFHVAFDVDWSTRTLADWAVVWSPRSSSTTSEMALALFWPADSLFESPQGSSASRNWLLGPVSRRFPVFCPGPFSVPPNWLAGGVPPISSGSAVDDVPLPEAEACVWLIATTPATCAA